MANYKFKYLRVNIKPNVNENTICRIDVSHLNKKGREAEWDRLDAKYPPDTFCSCYEQVERELPCFEREPIQETTK